MVQDGSIDWAAMYQGRPSPGEGNMSARDKGQT